MQHDDWGAAPHIRRASATCSPILGLTAAFVLALAVFAVEANASSLVFSDDFESGTTNAWTSDGTRERCIPVQTAADGGTPYRGKYMAKCNWNGTVAWNDPAAFSTLLLPNWTYQREFLLRFRFRIDANKDLTNGAKFLRLGFTSGNDSYWQFTQNNALFLYWGTATKQIGTSYWGGKDTLSGPLVWHRFEAYVKQDTNGTDGSIRVWVDGTQVWSVENTLTHASGTTWWPLSIGGNWSNNSGWEHDAANNVYFDDVEIYSDVGTGATGMLGDATAGMGGTTPTALAPPTNLRLVP